jgi:hypothetical protein
MYDMAPELPAPLDTNDDETSSIKSESNQGKIVPATSEESCTDGSISVKTEVVSDDVGNSHDSDERDSQGSEETNTASECEYGTESNEVPDMASKKQATDTPANDCSSTFDSCGNGEMIFTVNGKVDYTLKIKIERAKGEEVSVPTVFHPTGCDSDAVVPTSVAEQHTELDEPNDHRVPIYPEPEVAGSSSSDHDGQMVPSAPCRRQSASDIENEPTEIVSYGLKIDAQEAEE